MRPTSRSIHDLVYGDGAIANESDCDGGDDSDVGDMFRVRKTPAIDQQEDGSNEVCWFVSCATCSFL